MLDYLRIINFRIIKGAHLLSVQQCGLSFASCLRPRVPMYLLTVSQHKMISSRVSNKQKLCLHWRCVNSRSKKNNTSSPAWLSHHSIVAWQQQSY